MPQRSNPFENPNRLRAIRAFVQGTLQAFELDRPEGHYLQFYMLTGTPPQGFHRTPIMLATEKKYLQIHLDKPQE